MSTLEVFYICVISILSQHVDSTSTRCGPDLMLLSGMPPALSARIKNEEIISFQDSILYSILHLVRR